MASKEKTRKSKGIRNKPAKNKPKQARLSQENFFGKKSNKNSKHENSKHEKKPAEVHAVHAYDRASGKDNDSFILDMANIGPKSSLKEESIFISQLNKTSSQNNQEDKKKHENEKKAQGQSKNLDFSKKENSSKEKPKENALLNKPLLNNPLLSKKAHEQEKAQINNLENNENSSAKKNNFLLKNSFSKLVRDAEKTIKKDLNQESKSKIFKPKKTIKKTADLLGYGFHYFVEIEERFTHDFLFGYLPDRIRKYIRLIIPLLIMIFFLKAHLGLEPKVKKALALFIFISLLWALESLSIVVTALLIPVMSVLLNLESTGNPFASFSNPIIYLLLSGLIIAQAFRKHELDKMLAMKVIALSKGKIKRLLLFLMGITAVLGMWMSNTATIALMIPVIISISSEIKGRTEKNYTSMMLLAVGFSSAVGGVSTILGGNPNAIAAAFLQDIETFTFMDWSAIGFPVSVILFTIIYFIFLKIYNVSDEIIPISHLSKEAEKIKLNRSQKKLLLIFIPTILLWLFGEKIGHVFNFPKGFYATEVIGLSSSILLFAFRVLEWEDVRRIPWEIFLLVGGGLTLGQIIIKTNTASFLAEKLFSAISFLPLPLIIFLIIVSVMALANFVNNSSATIIFVPVLLKIAGLIGINYKLLAMSAAISTTISPLTPIAMPAFSIIYGTGKVSRREMVMTGFKVASICAPVLAVVIYVMNFLI